MNKKSSPAQAMTCSTCGRRFDIESSPNRPFCSERCQLIDLGRWLDEEISVPHEGGNAGSPGSPIEDEDEDDRDDDDFS